MDLRPRQIQIALVLAAVSLGVYFQTLGFEFVGLDDYLYVVRNPHLRDGLSGSALSAAFQANFGNWIPLTILSLHLDYALYGLEAAGYHATNLAHHTLSTLLLFFALSRMTGEVWRSGFVAAVFAIHPLHVESVAWVTERKDTLSGVFWMLTLLAYARYCESPGSIRRYGLVLLCLMLGLMSKPTVVTLPFVLLLLDYWPLGRLTRSDGGVLPGAVELRHVIFEKIPMFALVAGTSVITIAVQRASGFVSDLESIPTGLRIANAVESYAIYLWQTVWPTGLAAFYPHPMESISGWGVAASTILLVALTVFVFRVAAARPYAPVGWLWFLGTLIPVIGLVQVGMQARADRYMYLPLIGLSILATWGAADLAQRWRVHRTALALVAASVLVAFGAAAWIQTATWRNTEMLYRQALDVTDGNYLAYRALGSELLSQQRFDEAEQNFERAALLAPSWSAPRLGLADIEMARGHTRTALRAFEDELKRDPGNPDIAGRYGLALGLEGRHAEARVQLQRVLEANSGNAELHRAMANVEAALGDFRASVRHGREALRLRPNYTEAANNLAWTLATCHDPTIRNPAEAIHLIQDVALASSEPWLLDTLAAAYAAAGYFERAVATASRAATLADDVNAQEIREHLALYRSGKPFIAPDP
jgi:tetratricopeptide (TPR) repeat protein